jgi:hypothetical protein
VTRQEIVVRQSPRKLLKGLLLTFVFFVPSALLLGTGVLSAHPLALVGGGLGVAFSGPILLILLHALVQPSYLKIDDWGVNFRFYSVELAVPWENIREVSGGAGWPSLTFYDPDSVARAARFRGLPPLGWVLQIPTRAVSLIIRRPLANLYPTNRGQFLQHFRANERMFRFHYGLPTDLLEQSGREILKALKRWKPR